MKCWPDIPDDEHRHYRHRTGGSDGGINQGEHVILLMLLPLL